MSASMQSPINVISKEIREFPGKRPLNTREFVARPENLRRKSSIERWLRREESGVRDHRYI